MSHDSVYDDAQSRQTPTKYGIARDLKYTDYYIIQKTEMHVLKLVKLLKSKDS